MGLFDLLNKMFPPKDRDPHRDRGRNEVCHCGSGKKYKACHMPTDERKRSGKR
jgi:hypothetical protein